MTKKVDPTQIYHSCSMLNYRYSISVISQWSWIYRKTPTWCKSYLCLCIHVPLQVGTSSLQFLLCETAGYDHYKAMKFSWSLFLLRICLNPTVTRMSEQPPAKDFYILTPKEQRVLLLSQCKKFRRTPK